MDSRELLRRLAAARPDDPLWGVLLRRCVSLIRRSLWWRLQAGRRIGAQLPDDLAQEVLEKLLSHGRRGLLRFAGESHETFEGYIRRIAENILLDHLRRNWSRKELEHSLPPEELWRLEESFADLAQQPDRTDPEAGLYLREMREIVEKTLEEISLDPRQRALNRLLFQLYFVDGCSIPQIARMRAVTLSASSVGRRLTLLRKALRRAFLRRRWITSDRARPIRRQRAPTRTPMRRRER